MPVRLFRHLFTDRSYERYYSRERWESTYKTGYDLNTTTEDGRYGALMAVMRRYDRGRNVLDAGCGEGLLEEKYRPLSTARLLGIDFSQAAIEKAKARGIPGCEFRCVDYRNFRSDDHFSIIVFNEALYYVEDFMGAMADFGRFLEEDGVFVVSMFDTRVTRRIWKTLLERHKTVQGVMVRDERSGLRWTIRVLRPLPDVRGAV